MKHAYLILAHNEFELLGQLLQALDDKRNDIFIHFDRKLNHYPSFQTQFSSLYILEDRVDVRWGHVSQIKAEYALFEAATRQGRYAYYHLISGTHFPLKSQNEIHRFFGQSHQQEVLSYMASGPYQIDLKLHRYHFFLQNFTHQHHFYRRLNEFLWRVSIRIQKILHIRRHKSESFHQASNWVSVTGECVSYLLEQKKHILRKYRFTMCADEFFIPTELCNSGRDWKIRYEEKLLKYDIQRANAKVYHLADYDELIHSDCLFARKFSYAADKAIVDKLLIHITTNE